MSISKLKNTLLFNINNENNFLSSIIEITADPSWWLHLELVGGAPASTSH